MRPNLINRFTRTAGDVPAEARWIPSLNIAHRLAPWMVLVFFYAVAVVMTVRLLQLPVWKAGNEIAAALGIGIGALIALHNNAANDRWWEARKAWGVLINESRNLALKARAYIDTSPEDYQELANLLADFARALAMHVRGHAIDCGQLRSTDLGAGMGHMPGHLAGRVHELLSKWHRQGRLKDTLWIFDQHARQLMEVCGVCERVRSTPLASSYRSLLRWGLTIYILLAPWPVTLDIGWWSLPVVMIGIGFLLGMELAAEAIEEPFGNDGDDLPLEKFGNAIDEFVSRILADDSTLQETVPVATERRFRPVTFAMPAGDLEPVGW